MKQLLSKLFPVVFAAAICMAASAAVFAQATIVIDNGDAAGTGFNDTTPATPVGGNNGTTIGKQRLIAFQRAAAIWGAVLSSGPIIHIRASWAPLTCTARAGTLGSAGATSLRSGAPPNFPFSNTWYAISQANALANTDFNGATAEITAQFNLNVGTPGCLATTHWYYGLDNNHGTNIDLVTVLLHEFGHGLGFASFTDESTGQQAGTPPNDFPSVYDRFLLDRSTGKTWNQMTNAERQASAINTNNLVWNGIQVANDITANPNMLTGGKDAQGHPLMFAPNPVDQGSSISHWDTTETPNQLMEPNISRDLTHNVTVPSDLTFSLLRDLGWCAGCPAPPPPSPTPTPSPPPNDNFANAQVVAGCSGSVSGTNLAATKQSGEPTHIAASPGSHRSVWYQWQAPSSGSVTIDTHGSDFDTIMAVYTGTSVNALTLVPNGSNDDTVPGSDITSSVTINVTQGTTYRIAVDGYDNAGSGGDTGNIKLNWDASNCTPAATIFLEQGTTNQAVALDSVTFQRGPFRTHSDFNFSTDHLTRIILFTSNLGLNQFQPAPSVLKVTAGGTTLTVEKVAPVTGVSGLNASYIIVALPSGLPAGDLPLDVVLNGVSSSNLPTIKIIFP